MAKFKIIFEDDNILVVNKKAGILVHPTVRGEKNTLIEQIIQKYPKASLVHRLDRDTSGLLIIAKNDSAQTNLRKQFEQRQVLKKYYCLVLGKTPAKDIIVAKVGRRSHRAKMTTMKGKEAVTRYEVINYYRDSADNIYSFLDVQIISGRTHQIRVHFKSQGFPVVGDQLYARGKEKKLWVRLGLNRQFLHAYYLEFINPTKNIRTRFKIDLSDDLKKILQGLDLVSLDRV
jgi:RluA family pseudouridine synthase